MTTNAPTSHASNDATIRTGMDLLPRTIVDWFPLLPRTRPSCRALTARIDEIRDLAHSASHGPHDRRLALAAETHNKAALLLSDCGLTDLAYQLCWQQFDIFYAAAPLTGPEAKLALQPIVNLGRLLIRAGDGPRAYDVFQNTYDAVRRAAPATIEGRHIDFTDFVDDRSARQDLCRFLWTVLLADGTRALTTTGHWDKALRLLEEHKGIGKRLFDGRQVAILARCAAGDSDGALEMLGDSSYLDPWEHAVAGCLRTVALQVGKSAPETAIVTMVEQYLHLRQTPGHPVFSTRLGLVTLDLAAGRDSRAEREVTAKIARDAAASNDAYVARDVLSYASSRSSLSDADIETMNALVNASGLRGGRISTEIVDGLNRSVRASGFELSRLLNHST